MVSRLPPDDPKPPRPNKGGRPTALTPEVSAAILGAVAGGSPYKFAAEAAGVSERAVYAWLKRGRRERSGRYRQFVQDIKRARAEAVVDRVRRIGEAGAGTRVVERRTATEPDGTVVVTERFAPPQWQADAWWLERMYPDQFGRDRGRLAELGRTLQALIVRYQAVLGGASCPRN